MHLTAALLSDAGLALLQTLEERGPSPDKTVGIFTKTAVLAVRAHFAKVASAGGTATVDARVVNRQADVDPHSQRNLTGTFTTTKNNIDHIVVVLSSSATSDVTSPPAPEPGHHGCIDRHDDGNG